MSLKDMLLTIMEKQKTRLRSSSAALLQLRNLPAVEGEGSKTKIIGQCDLRDDSVDDICLKQRKDMNS